MKITQFDPDYSAKLATGDVFIGGSSGSNSGFAGGDVVGEPGDLSVVGLRSTVALSSNMTGLLGDVLTIIGTSPLTANFATPSNAGSGNFELNIEGGQSVIKAHGATGATETIDPTDGNVHTLTLDANCTITLDAPVGTGACVLELWVTENATGGWAITWPGSVTEQGTHDTTLGTTQRVVVESVDGGGSWVASWISSGTDFVTGRDVLGSSGDLSVAGLRQRVSLSSNMGDSTVGTVLTTMQTSPWQAQFAVPSNSGSSGSNSLLRTTGGAGQTTTIAASGTAKTLMVGGANYFDLTLTANCTIGFTGWPASGSISEIGVRTTEDGTGGWTPTFSGVTWVGGGAAPAHTTTALSSTEYAFWTDNGGSTIIGGQLGPSAATVSAGSNSTRVREISTAGASTSLWSPFDHAHDGIGTITASSSNTMQRGTFNLRTGNGISFGLTDTDGDGELDTMTIHSSGGGGGSGGSSNYSGVLWSSGTAMPGSPVTNQRVTRTDLNLDFYYDGTRWVSVDLFTLQSNYHGMTAGAAVSTTQANAFRGTIPDLQGGTDCWLVRAGVTTNIAGGGTALGASHKWVLTITDNVNTVLATVSIASGASSTNRYDSATVGALMGATPIIFSSTWTKTGTPGNLIAYPWILYYRIVAT